MSKEVEITSSRSENPSPRFSKVFSDSMVENGYNHRNFEREAQMRAGLLD